MCVCLTTGWGPYVKPHGAVQCLIRPAKGIEEEEATANGGEKDDSPTEEDNSDVEACWNGIKQVWEDWEGGEERQ